MKDRQKLLTDEQWELVGALLPPLRQRPDRRGRPPASNRACFEGILWILQTGAAWRFLAAKFSSPSTSLGRGKPWGDGVGDYFDRFRGRVRHGSRPAQTLAKTTVDSAA